MTVAQFRRFAGADGYQTDAERDGKGGERHEGHWKWVRGITWKSGLGFKQDDNHPVVLVSLHDGQEFARWLSQEEGLVYSLPREAQWEYACRAGTEGLYSWGNDESLVGQHSWHIGNSSKRTRAVGQLAPNSFGIYDMHGTVFEWARDCLAMLEAF